MRSLERLFSSRAARIGIVLVWLVFGGRIVLAGTFTMLATLPLKTLTELGFTIAFGVLLDTFIVRSVLVPALVFDLGARVWSPSALARHRQTPHLANAETSAEPTCRPGRPLRERVPETATQVG